MKIVFVNAEKDFNNLFFNELKARLTGHEVVSWKGSDDAPANDFEIAVVMGQFTREQMVTQPKLLLIQAASAGYDGIDVDAASEMGIWVAYSPSGITGNAVSVAEFAVLLILGASRNLGMLIQPPRAGRQKAPAAGNALSGKTVCIIGLGTIGRLLAKRLQPFDVKLLAVDDHPKDMDKEIKVFKNVQIKQAIADADFVVLCVRATPENENLFNASMLKAMKQGASLINIARGTLIDEDALTESLKSGHIAYAGLDVVKTEPVSPLNPLLKLPQVLITPHVAGTTDITLHGTVNYVEEVIRNFVKGKKPEALVNDVKQPKSN